MMALKLVSPYKSRERILCFGEMGVGKSELAARCILGSTGRGFVVDNNNAWERIFDYVPEAEERITLTALEAEGQWKEHLATLKRYRGLVDRDDWLVVDESTPLYDAAKAEFAHRAYGVELDDLFIDIRTKAKLAKSRNKDEQAEGEKDSTWGGFSGKEWVAIAEIMKEYLNLIVNWPCHVVSTADVTKVDAEDSAEIKKTYGGFKPRGHRRMPNVHQSVFHLTKGAAGQYWMQARKDRMREQLWMEKMGGMHRIDVGDFAKTYLSGIAKWKWVTV